MALFSYIHHFVLLVYMYTLHFSKEEAVRSFPSPFPSTQLAHYGRRTHCAKRLVSDFATLAPVLGPI